MEYFWLIVGFALLFGGGHYLIFSSVKLARRFNISDMVIGITVVAFGTSAPELFVSLKAVFAGSADISISNVVGSNIANIALVMGFVAIIYPLRVKKPTIWIDWTVMMAASLLLYYFSWNNEKLNNWEGIVFLVLLGLYMSWLLYDTKVNKKSVKSEVEENGPKQLAMIWVILILVGSIAGLYVGSDLLVTNARKIALDFGISERVVGITMIAFGTSVPELATSLIAAVKKNTDISIGNIIGSNIFNILAILGITSTVQSLNVNPDFLDWDYPWMIGIAVLLLMLMVPLKNGVINRWKGALMLGLYVFYIYKLF